MTLNYVYITSKSQKKIEWAIIDIYLLGLKTMNSKDLLKRCLKQRFINLTKQKLRQLVIQKVYYQPYYVLKIIKINIKYTIKQQHKHKQIDYDKLLRKKLCEKYNLNYCSKCFNLKNSRECYLRVCDRKIGF